MKKHVFFLIITFCTMKLNASLHHELVDVKKYIPTIQIDLKYATDDNFTKKVIYKFNYCLLRKETVIRLKEVQDELEKMGLGLKIWDGYRPFYAQVKFWEFMPDEKYVSDPKKGGRHTRGTAVDLTLITKDNKELLMPSSFDDFSKKAHRDYQNASEEEIINRSILEHVMEKHGFIGYPTEWWHFDLAGWESFAPIKYDPPAR